MFKLAHKVPKFPLTSSRYIREIVLVVQGLPVDVKILMFVFPCPLRILPSLKYRKKMKEKKIGGDEY